MMQPLTCGRIIIQHREGRTVGHQYDRFEPKVLGTAQEVFQGEPGLSRPETRVTHRMKGGLHRLLAPFRVSCRLNQERFPKGDSSLEERGTVPFWKPFIIPRIRSDLQGEKC